MAIQQRFYQFRQGDSILIDGEEYMKVWRKRTTTGAPYNAIRKSDNEKRFVLDSQLVTPTDDYWKDRISPINSDVHEM